jgi:hypothetical protein
VFYEFRPLCFILHPQALAHMPRAKCGVSNAEMKLNNHNRWTINECLHSYMRQSLSAIKTHTRQHTKHSNLGIQLTTLVHVHMHIYD